MSLTSLVSNRSRLVVRQAREMAEVLLGFETRNRYAICTPEGEVAGYCVEEGSGLGAALTRNLLGVARPAHFHIYDPQQREIARGQKPFRLWFHRINVYEGTTQIGAVERRIGLFRRVFRVEDADGAELATIQSGILNFRQFEVRENGQKVGEIAKKWGGLTRELFTDADTFGVELGQAGPKLRPLLLLATFLIDLTCFEKGG